MLIFVNEGIRKLSDLNTVRGNKVAPGGKDELIQTRTCATNKIGKSRVRASPGGLSVVLTWILGYLDTWSGFEAAKTAPWPSRGLHHCGKFL